MFFVNGFFYFHFSKRNDDLKKYDLFLLLKMATHTSKKKAKINKPCQVFHISEVEWPVRDSVEADSLRLFRARGNSCQAGQLDLRWTVCFCQNWEWRKGDDCWRVEWLRFATKFEKCNFSFFLLIKNNLRGKQSLVEKRFFLYFLQGFVTQKSEIIFFNGCT